MARRVAHRLNNSPRSVADLEALAKRAPHVAKSYLQDVSTRLRELGQTTKAKVLEDLLDDPDLLKSMQRKPTQLGEIFTHREGGWASLQRSRAATVGWEPVETNKLPPTYLRGTVSVKGDPMAGSVRATLTTENGTKLNLVPGGDMSLWFDGLRHDGELSLKGKIDVNGNFKVHGYALAREGFETFTFGRVQVSEAGKVEIETSEGNVEVVNEALKKKLARMPMLGVILPGNPTAAGKALQYEGNPHELFALGRFTDTGVRAPKGGVKGDHVLCDMAYSKFSGQPFVLPKGQEQRADHNNRFWALGDFKSLRDAKGPLVHGQFIATYLSTMTDQLSLKDQAAADASGVQAAVSLGEADDDLPLHPGKTG